MTPELIISELVMKIQQNKCTSLNDRMTMPKVFVDNLKDLSHLNNTCMTLIQMLDSKDASLSTLCLVLDILNVVLPNANYQSQSQFSGLYYKLIKNYKSNTVLYHLLSMTCMHYVDLETNNILSVYKLLRGFMHSEHKKIKYKAIQQYYTFCIHNHAILIKSHKQTSILDVFLDRNLVVSHMIREQSSVALSSLLYFYSKQEAPVKELDMNEDEEGEKKVTSQLKRVETFLEADVFPALFRNMELSLLERDYIAYLCEVLGRYCKLKGKVFMQTNFVAIITHIDQLTSTEAFIKCYYTDQHYIYSCLTFVLNFVIQPLLSHDDGYMPAIKTIIDAIEQWPQLTPNQPKQSQWLLAICLSNLHAFIPLAGTTISAFDTLSSVLFRLLEHTDDIVLQNTLDCIHLILLNNNSYVRVLFNLVTPFLIEDLPKLIKVNPSMFLKKYYAYCMALIRLMEYWHTTNLMTPKDLEVIKIITTQAIQFKVMDKDHYCTMELVLNIGYQLLGHLAHFISSTEFSTILYTGSSLDQLNTTLFNTNSVTSNAPQNELDFLFFFLNANSLLRCIQYCSEYQLQVNTCIEVVNKSIALLLQCPSLFGSTSLTEYPSLRQNHILTLFDRELVFRSLILESIQFLIHNCHSKQAKTIFMTNYESIFKKHIRFYLQIDLTIDQCQVHNQFYKSRANGSYLGTILHLLYKSTDQINLQSDLFLQLYRWSSDTHMLHTQLPILRCLTALSNTLNELVHVNDSIQRQCMSTCLLLLQSIKDTSIIRQKIALSLFIKLVTNTTAILDPVAATTAFQILQQYLKSTELVFDVFLLICHLLNDFSQLLPIANKQQACQLLLNQIINNTNVQQRQYDILLLCLLQQDSNVTSTIGSTLSVLASLITDPHPLMMLSGCIGSALLGTGSPNAIEPVYSKLMQLPINYEEYYILNDVAGIESTHLLLYFSSKLTSKLISIPTSSFLLQHLSCYLDCHPLIHQQALIDSNYINSMNSTPVDIIVATLTTFKQCEHKQLQIQLGLTIKQQVLSLGNGQSVSTIVDMITALLMATECNTQLDVLIDCMLHILSLNTLNSSINASITISAIQLCTKIINKQIVGNTHLVINASQLLLNLLSNSSVTISISDLIAIAFTLTTHAQLKLQYDGCHLLNYILKSTQFISDIQSYQAQFSSALKPLFSSTSPDLLLSMALFINSSFIQQNEFNDKNRILFKEQLDSITSTTSDSLFLSILSCAFECKEIDQMAYDKAITVAKDYEILQKLCHYQFNTTSLFKSLSVVDGDTRWLVLLKELLSISTDYQLIYGCTFNSYGPLLLDILQQLSLEELDLFSDSLVRLDCLQYHRTTLYEYINSADPKATLYASICCTILKISQVEAVEWINLLLVKLTTSTNTSHIIVESIWTICLYCEENDQLTSKSLLAFTLLINITQDASVSLELLSKVCQRVQVDQLSHLLYINAVKSCLLLNNHFLVMGLLTVHNDIIHSQLNSLVDYFIKIMNASSIIGLQGIKWLSKQYDLKNSLKRKIIETILKKINEEQCSVIELEEGLSILQFIAKEKGYLISLSYWTRCKHLKRIVELGLPQHLGLLKGYIQGLKDTDKLRFQSLMTK